MVTRFSTCPQCGFTHPREHFQGSPPKLVLQCTECGYHEEYTATEWRIVKPWFSWRWLSRLWFKPEAIEISRVQGNSREGLGTISYTADGLGFFSAFSKPRDGSAGVDFDELTRKMAALFEQQIVSSYRITRWNSALKRVEIVAEASATN